VINIEEKIPVLKVLNLLINKGFLNTKHCDNMATNVNSENGRSRIEESSAGKHEYGGKSR
jgi:hypothetical protein